MPVGTELLPLNADEKAAVAARELEAAAEAYIRRTWCSADDACDVVNAAWSATLPGAVGRAILEALDSERASIARRAVLMTTNRAVYDDALADELNRAYAVVDIAVERVRAAL